MPQFLFASPDCFARSLPGLLRGLLPAFSPAFFVPASCRWRLRSRWPRRRPARASPGRSFAFYDGDRLAHRGAGLLRRGGAGPRPGDRREMAALKQRGRLPLARVVPGAATRAGPSVLATLEKRGFVGFAVRRPPARTDATAAEELLLEARRRAPAARVVLLGQRSSGCPRWPPPSRASSPTACSPAGVPRDGEDSAPEVLDDIEGVRRLADLVEVRGKLQVPVRRHRAGAQRPARAGPGHRPHPGRAGLRPLGDGGRDAAWAWACKEWVPRRILALYDGEEEPDLPYTMVHRLAAVPLEYLGYVVDYHDVNSGRCPPAICRPATPASSAGSRTTRWPSPGPTRASCWSSCPGG